MAAGIGIHIGVSLPTGSDRGPASPRTGPTGDREGRPAPGTAPAAAPTFEEPGAAGAGSRSGTGLAQRLAALREQADELFQRFGPIKFYPPYPPHEPARAELVRRFNGLAAEADRLVGQSQSRADVAPGAVDAQAALGLSERVRAELRADRAGLTRVAEPLRELA